MSYPGLALEQAPPVNAPFRFFLTAPLFGLAAVGLLLWSGPELLAACEGVLGVLNHGTPTKEDGTPNTHWKHIDIIRAAIAKATGEES